MANPASDYPTAVHTATDVSAFGSSKLGSTTPTHTNLEGKQEEEIAALQTKVGIGSSAPATDGHVLTVQADGSTAWEALPAAAAGDMKADGSVDFTAVVAYNADKTFSTDQDIVSKKYVDDAIVLAGGYTDEQAQDAVGGILTDSDRIDFTYDDAGGTITADVKDGSISLAKQANLAANTIIGRITASTGVPEALTATNVRTIINVADGATANTKATGAEVDTGTDDAKFVTAKAMKDSGYLSSMTDVTAATDTAAGKVELATTAETTTGTDTGRAVTPDGLAGSSIFGVKSVQITCFDYATDTATGDGKGYIVIPAALNGMNLVSVHAKVITAGTTNTTDIQIANVTDSVDMLSTKLTIDSGETGSDTAAAAAVIDTTKDDVATNDLLRIDVDAVSTTKAKGLIVTLGFQLP